MGKRYSWLAALWSAPLLLGAQARNANWLNQCVLTFNSIAPQVNELPPGTQAGTLEISNAWGQLELTAGGAAGIRDSSFQPIANHPPMDAWLNNLQPSSALLMPRPGYPDRLFLFFHRYFNPAVRKYGWLEIGPDGPGGQLRMTDIGLQYFMLNPTVKCTGIAHANGEDYWFLTQAVGTNEVHAFRIGDGGIEEGPVISPGGTFIGETRLHGFMVASVQGDRLISQSVDDLVPNVATIELYGFDPATGQAALQHSFAEMTGSYWGAEFSPSGQYLYILTQKIVPDPDGDPVWRHNLYQYDLSQSDIEASRVTIATQDYFLGGSGPTTNNLCLAPDGKIYVNRFPTSAFGVIHQPDQAAPACMYAENGLLLNGCIMSVPQPMKHYHDDLGLGAPELNEPALSVWPNPLQDKGTLRHTADGPVHLRWSDALGRVVLTGRGTVIHGRLELDAGSLASGQYLLSVTHANGLSRTTRVNVMR